MPDAEDSSHGMLAIEKLYTWLKTWCDIGVSTDSS
jgi:hypothetical protein